MKYKRLFARYIADMYEMTTKHPRTWKELKNDNLSVTKITIPFASIGADHACEEVNKTQVHSDLIGISNNGNARQCFFFFWQSLQSSEANMVLISTKVNKDI